MILRREFVTALGSAAAWPLAVREADGQAADHRLLERDDQYAYGVMDCRFCAAAAGTRLDRWPHCRDRVPLDGRREPTRRRGRG